MKKIVSLLLVFMLAVSMLGVTAFAEADVEITPNPDADVTITKHPTGETVDEGDAAVFIAKADNATAIIWRIVSNDTTNTVRADEAEDFFRGLKVEGLGTERLTLSNIPASMNGWRVEAMFEGKGGPVFSNGALIRVNGAASQELSKPSISTQPVGASLEIGESATLAVAATASGATLRFQWYQNSTESNQGGTAISGATASSYTPPQTEGTNYYYVAVRSSDGSRESDPVNSEVVAVTYTAPSVSEPAGEEGGTETEGVTPLAPQTEGQTGETQVEEPTPEVTTPVSVPEQRANTALNVLSVVGGVVVLAAVGGGIAALVLKRRGADDEDFED